MKKITALMAVAVLGLAACGSSNDNSSSQASASSGGGGYSKSTSTNATSSNVATSNKSGEVKVQMVDDAFQPKTITGKAGSTVKVKLNNTGSREHNFKIDGQKKADADVEPGKNATVSVKIPASGSVQFYCEYHKGLGMVGTVKAS